MSLFISNPKLGFTHFDSLRLEKRTTAVKNRVTIPVLFDLMETRGRPPKLKSFYEKPREEALNAQMEKDIANLGNA